MMTMNLSDLSKKLHIVGDDILRGASRVTASKALHAHADELSAHVDTVEQDEIAHANAPTPPAKTPPPRAPLRVPDKLGDTIPAAESGASLASENASLRAQLARYQSGDAPSDPVFDHG
jgi:hypothetical protein